MTNQAASIPVHAPDRRCSRTIVIAVLSGLFLAVNVFAEPPDHTSSLNAWTTARSWLDRGRVPNLDSNASAINMDGVEGASVVLRLNGRTVGSASEFANDDRLLRRVVGRAFAQALGDRTLRGLPESLREEAPGRLTLEVEFAGEREPLLGGDLSSQKGGHGIETNSVDHCRNECKRRTECAFWEDIQHDIILSQLL